MNDSLREKLKQPLPILNTPLNKKTWENLQKWKKSRDKKTGSVGEAPAQPPTAP